MTQPGSDADWSLGEYHADMVGDVGGPISRRADPVPFRLRIGVTGHRHLPEGIKWRDRIDAALGLIEARLALAGDTPLAWLVISSLAEGADRLVAEAILDRPGSLLEVPLPLSRDDYQTDFKSDESKAAFARLYDQASLITRSPRFESRDSAYEWAGLAVVGRSDIIIAVWDGLPSRGVGGTADIVRLARRYGRPVVHIPTGSGQEILVLHPFAEDEPSPSSMEGVQVPSGSDAQPPERVTHADPFTPLRRALRGMEAYNRIDIGADRLATASEQARTDLMKYITTPEGRAIWEPIASWLVPRYATADLLANAARGRVKWLLAITFTFPVLAIATVAVQSQFLPNLRGVLWAEVVFLIAVPLVMGLDRISRFRPDRAERRTRRSRLPMSAQQQWVSCRHLAERLRSAFFLAAVEWLPATDTEEESSKADGEYSEVGAADLQPLQVDTSPIQGFHESAEGWLPRLYAEIWRRRPPALAAHSDLPLVRYVLAEQWIRGQETYHIKAAHRNRRNDYIATTAIISVFVVTAAVAALHATGVGAGSSDVEKTLTLVAIVFPALAAVATALTHHFEFRRHRETSESMKRRLGYAADVVARAPTLPELRRQAAAAERLMMTENRDWFALMRLHELELHA
jgi:hypothetical protein